MELFIQLLWSDSLCGLPVFLWIIILLGLGIFVGSSEVNPRVGIRPPSHPPGWKNIKRSKKRGVK